MSDHSSPDSAVDRAIDGAVRQIMNVDPPAGLRRRVLARIEGPPARPRYVFRVAMAAAACAVLILAVLMFKPPPAAAPESVRTAVEPAAPLSSAPAPAPAPAAVQSTTVAAPPAARRAFTTSDIRMPRISNVFGARDARVTPTAAAVADVVFPASESGGAEASADVPGNPRAIGIPRIAVAPIQVERIRVDPVAVRK